MADLTPLSRWFQMRPEYTVALDKEVSTSSSEFESRVFNWLSILAPHNGSSWAVYHEDALEFVAIVFALWQLGRTACIPGDNRPGTIQRLKSRVDGFAGQFPTESTVNLKSNSPGAEIDFDWQPLEAEFVGLEIYTSGSTGEPTAISKTIRQLELEVQALESLWPSRQDGVVLSTVSHQHLYGMTFRLFWPLASARTFERQTIEYTEDILYLAKKYVSYSLVSSPSHLARMNTSLNWSEIIGKCQYVMSSAAPLKRADSLNVGSLLVAPVREIYGSSETGALAWRIQQNSKTDALWHPLPTVKLSLGEAGRLVANAPYLDSTDDCLLSDKGEFCEDDGFKLIGRVDRVVKVEGKRVSLSAMENLLLEHAWIKNARVLTIERRRIETAVVVELSDLGGNALEIQGQKILTRVFREILSDYFEAVVLPRKWRIVERMPYNPLGKLPLEALQQLFTPSIAKWPQIKKIELLEHQLTMSCFIPPGLVYFDGHFPGNPILPGIVQVHWAEAYGREHLKVKGVFAHLEAVKFQQVIMPNLTVTLSLRLDAEKAKLHFNYESEKGAHSSGRICFR